MTDRCFGLFEPDALLPAQFYAAFRGCSAVRGEKRLMLAVLQDALDCYQKYAFARDVHGCQLFADAEGWIACEDRDWYFSFENICETLEINPEYLRRGVHDWKTQAARSWGGRDRGARVPSPTIPCSPWPAEPSPRDKDLPTFGPFGAA